MDLLEMRLKEFNPKIENNEVILKISLLPFRFRKRGDKLGFPVLHKPPDLGDFQYQNGEILVPPEPEKIKEVIIRFGRLYAPHGCIGVGLEKSPDGLKKALDLVNKTRIVEAFFLLPMAGLIGILIMLAYTYNSLLPVVFIGGTIFFIYRFFKQWLDAGAISFKWPNAYLKDRPIPKDTEMYITLQRHKNALSLMMDDRRRELPGVYAVPFAVLDYCIRSQRKITSIDKAFQNHIFLKSIIIFLSLIILGLVYTKLIGFIF